MSEPAQVNLVTLEGYIKDSSGVATPGVDVYIRIYPAKVNGTNTIFSTRKVHLLTDDTGYFSIELPAGYWTTVSIPYSTFQKSGLLPFTGTININQLGG